MDSKKKEQSRGCNRVFEERNEEKEEEEEKYNEFEMKWTNTSSERFQTIEMNIIVNILPIFRKSDQQALARISLEANTTEIKYLMLSADQIFLPSKRRGRTCRSNSHLHDLRMILSQSHERC
ncbi:hypothetical protein V1477_012329 [Vespula maculifrons]|uniref:Uncharacterized protein n=1 Tax=Vespula maculifrons TaxID=7453 RepID=A0ABD2BYQ6_VESMC